MAATVVDPDECLSPHWEMRQKDHLELVWHKPFEGAGRVRALAWTCDCRAIVYELLPVRRASVHPQDHPGRTDTKDQGNTPLAGRGGAQGVACPTARRDAIDGPALTRPRSLGRGRTRVHDPRHTSPPPIAADISGPTEVSMPSSRVRPPTTYTATPHPTRTDGVDADQGPRTISSGSGQAAGVLLGLKGYARANGVP